MSEDVNLELACAIADERFVEVDIALRRGRHIDREDASWYQFLTEHYQALAGFYERYGCELHHTADGYYFLLPTGDRLGRRHLSVAEMLVGQGLALMYLDPAMVRSAGVVERDAALGHLAAVMGTDALMAAFNPKKKRLDERVAQQTVRQRYGEALRRLAALGFVEMLSDTNIRLRSPLMRFAEPVRGEDSPENALRELVARGQVVVEAPAEATGEATPARSLRASFGPPGEPVPTELALRAPDETQADAPELRDAASPAFALGFTGSDDPAAVEEDEECEDGYGADELVETASALREKEDGTDLVPDSEMPAEDA